MCTPEDFVEFLSICGIGTDNIKNNASRDDRCLVFVSMEKPPITLVGYVQRLVIYFNLEAPILVCSIIYIERMKSCEFLIADRSLHRLVAATMICAYKMNSDRPVNSICMSKVTGLPAKELVRLEQAVLDVLKWRMMITPFQYQSKVEHIQCCTTCIN
jgi:hypothetical protein